MLMCAQINSTIDQEQNKTLWVPSGTIWWRWYIKKTFFIHFLVLPNAVILQIRQQLYYRISKQEFWNWKSFENAAQHVFYSVYNSSVMMCNFQMEFKCFGHVNKKRKENNKKIQRHVIMKSCCLWTYYLNIENKVTYSSPFSTCQNVIWTSSSNQVITIGTSMFSILSVVFKTWQKCTAKHSEM